MSLGMADRQGNPLSGGEPINTGHLGARGLPSIESHQAMPGPEGRAGRITYAAIGASDTVGIGAADPVNESWVALVARRLPTGSKFLRLGLSGSTAPEAVRHQLPRAKKAKPDLVTVWLALNDFNLISLNKYRRALDRIVRISANGSRVFVGNIPDLSEVPAYAARRPHELMQQVRDWNAAIAGVAAENNAVLVDLFGASQALGTPEIPLVAEDGFHPSTYGYRVIAELFWNSISQDPIIGPAVDPETG